jgi:hypothetical protein
MASTFTADCRNFFRGEQRIVEVVDGGGMSRHTLNEADSPAVQT